MPRVVFARAVRAASLPPARSFDGVKVFSATMHAQRDVLGETVTTWLREHRDIELVDIVVTQSSDAAFHCITITLFHRQPRAAAT